MDIEIIRQRIRDARYLIKSHAVVHAMKEGFDRKHMVEAILRGTVIEDYTADQRALVCGKTNLAGDVDVYLHVVCEYADPLYIELVTAYIPDQQEWESPPFRRREGKKR